MARRRRARRLDRRAPELTIAGRDFVRGTIRYLLQFGMLEKRPALTAYAARLAERPAAQRADARNAAVAKEHGLPR